MDLIVLNQVWDPWQQHDSQSLPAAILLCISHDAPQLSQPQLYAISESGGRNTRGGTTVGSVRLSGDSPSRLLAAAGVPMQVFGLVRGSLSRPGWSAEGPFSRIVVLTANKLAERK